MSRNYGFRHPDRDDFDLVYRPPAIAWLLALALWAMIFALVGWFMGWL